MAMGEDAVTIGGTTLTIGSAYAGAVTLNGDATMSRTLNSPIDLSSYTLTLFQDVNRASLTEGRGGGDGAVDRGERVHESDDSQRENQRNSPAERGQRCWGPRFWLRRDR